MVLPSHNPLLCVGEGFYILGPRPQKLLRGRLFCWSGYGERIPCTDLKIAALIEREGRTR